MEEKTIAVRPFKVFENLVDINLSITIENINETFSTNGSLKINLHNRELKNGNILKPREVSNRIMITVEANWIDDNTENKLYELVGKGEDPNSVLGLRARLTCKNTLWSSRQEKLKISEIGKKNLVFEVDLRDVSQLLVFESYLTREQDIGTVQDFKAAFPFTIVSENDFIQIQVDDVPIIGGNHLPILPKNIKNALFEITLDDDVTIPTIYFPEDLELFFRRNDLLTVNTAFIMGMPAFLDHYLKWAIFLSRPDRDDKDYKALIDKFAIICGKSRDQIFDIIEEDSDKEKIKSYLELSQLLFSGIQTKAGINFKKELESYINQEQKLKKEIK